MEKIWEKLYASLTKFLLGWMLKHYWRSFGQAAMSWGIALGGGWGGSFYYCPYIFEMKCPQSRGMILDATIREWYDPLGLITTLTLSGRREVTYFFSKSLTHSQISCPFITIIHKCLPSSGDTCKVGSGQRQKTPEHMGLFPDLPLPSVGFRPAAPPCHQQPGVPVQDCISCCNYANWSQMWSHTTQTVLITDSHGCTLIFVLSPHSSLSLPTPLCWQSYFRASNKRKIKKGIKTPTCHFCSSRIAAVR